MFLTSVTLKNENYRTIPSLGKHLSSKLTHFGVPDHSSAGTERVHLTNMDIAVRVVV